MLKRKVVLPYQLRRELKQQALNEQVAIEEGIKSQQQKRLLELIAFQSQVSSQVSLTCRIINVGILTTMLSIALNGSKHIEYLSRSTLPLIALLCLICGFALLCDYLHYVFNYKTGQRAIGNPEHYFETRCVFYRAANFCFASKQYLSLLAAGLFLLFIVCYFALLNSSSLLSGTLAS